jgi:hypothetical protein
MDTNKTKNIKAGYRMNMLVAPLNASSEKHVHTQNKYPFLVVLLHLPPVTLTHKVLLQPFT